MDIIQLYPHHIGVPEIIEEIDHLMNSLYSEDSNDLLPLGALNSEFVYFAGVYIQEELAACGAVVFKKADKTYGEFKRIYVKPKFRGQNLSKGILDHLITESNARGVRTIRLETGNKQVAAIKLYETFGFKRRDVYGDYEHDPTSVYMELNCL
ncbi:GNAT family N-acetyltransferase [Vibrio sp. vnigr-6D03]|uniref:GNAT family N-acetyltransferase n=1 Tax=Vibrio sp. vnigr-6D03 TaxID=2058088 RepID=UPI000C32DF24|nr:GNAT family N-acetyltransferase [Vibrio sp. vnigr-6D03]PKF80776.1 GNAT family N-acetyltransferase [Vibrio sp. vnigr-6D03]